MKSVTRIKVKEKVFVRRAMQSGVGVGVGVEMSSPFLLLLLALAQFPTHISQPLPLRKKSNAFGEKQFFKLSPLLKNGDGIQVICQLFLLLLLGTIFILIVHMYRAACTSTSTYVSAFLLVRLGFCWRIPVMCEQLLAV